MQGYLSLIAWCSAAMALKAACIVDIAALIAPPIIGTRHVPPAPSLNSGRRGNGIWLSLITSLTPIAEVKIQKSALHAVPFAVELDGLLVAGRTVTGPRARSFPLFLAFLLLRAPISVNHDRLQVTQLRFYYPRYPLHHVHLRHWSLSAGGEAFGLNGRFRLRGIGLVVHGTHFVVGEAAHLRIHYHGGLGLRGIAPVAEAIIGLGVGILRGRGVVKRLLLLRVVVERHGRIVAVQHVHLGHAWHRRNALHVGHVLHGRHGRIVTHCVKLTVLAITLIRGTVHTHSTQDYYDMFK